MSNYFKKYYLKHQVEILAKRALYCQENQDLVHSQQHSCYQKHRKKYQEKSKKYKDNHRDYYLKYLREYRKKNKQYYQNYSKDYYRKNAEDLKQKSKLNYYQNRERYIQYSKDWAKRNQARSNELKKLSYKQHPEKKRLNSSRRRARLRNSEGQFSLAEWNELLVRYNFRCAICKRKFLEKELTVDHIIPLSKGGKNYISNIQPACRSCNAKKKDKIIQVSEIRSFS